MGRRKTDLVARVEGVLPGETATARAAYASFKGERIILLLIFCRNRNVMGVLVNHRLTTAMATVGVTLIVSLNVFLLYQTFFS